MTYMIRVSSLDSFIARTFPLKGNLHDLACGHPGLKQCPDDSILTVEAWPDPANPRITGKTQVYLGREPADGSYPGDPKYVPGWFGRHDVYKHLATVFRDRLHAHLAPRLGHHYETFEKAAREVPGIRRPGRLSTASLSRLCTIARDVVYLADAENEIVRLRDRGVGLYVAPAASGEARQDIQATQAIQDAVETQASGPCAVRCRSVEIGKIADQLGAIRQYAPATYQHHLGSLVDTALRAIARAREAACASVAYGQQGGIVPTIAREVQVVEYEAPLLAEQQLLSVQDRTLGGSAGTVTEAASRRGKSLLERLLCCFSPTEAA